MWSRFWKRRSTLAIAVCLGMCVLIACAGMTMDVQGEFSANFGLFKVAVKGRVAKVECDVNGTGQFLDKDGKPIGDPFDVPPGINTYELPKGATHCHVSLAGGDSDGPSRGAWANSWFYRISGANFSFCAIEAPTMAEAEEEFYASLNGKPSPTHSTTLMNLDMKPVGNVLGDWSVLVAEEREIVSFKLYYDNKLIADENSPNFQVTYDPAVGGRIEGVTASDGDGGDGPLGKIGNALKPLFAPANPANGVVRIEYTTADEDFEYAVFTFQK